jgi:hypothetical protein
LAAAGLSLAVAGQGGMAAAAEPAWRYVVPRTGEAMEHPPLRALSLSERKPPDLKESAHYRGSRRRYAEFRFGPAGSRLVTVVLDWVSDAETHVYVDGNRDRLIEDNERLAGRGPRYHVPLSIELPKGSRTERISRTVVLRLGRAGRSLSYATAGYMEGSLRLDGRDVPARRVDANGNGGMADPVDLLWINWKGDGQWNPFIDRLPLMPIVQLEKQRYVVRSDWAGERLSLAKLEGSGELQLALPRGKSKGDFLEVHLLLAGRDGSIARLDLAQDRVEVPVGEYSPYELTVVARDPVGGTPWTFLLGRDFDWSGTAAGRGYPVQSHGRVVIAPLDHWTLDAKPDRSDLRYRPGEAITVRPRLETADRLTLRVCYRSEKTDSSARHPGAEVCLTTAGGKTLDSVTSGFS